MSDDDYRVPAIKYYQLHGLEKGHPYPQSSDSECAVASLPLISWWSNRVERTYAKFNGFSDIRILFQCFFLSLIIPFCYFNLPLWFYFSDGGYFVGKIDPDEPIFAIFFAPIIETLIFFFPLLEVARYLSLPRWFSYPLIFVFFESLHDQRHFFEHPLMWMTGYMFIVAYEAGRGRSLLHAILFCTIVHEAYNLAICLLDPSIY